VRILFDSSVWIECFRGKSAIVSRAQALINEKNVVTCDAVLAELLPSCKHRNEYHLIALLKSVEKQPLFIDWDAIVIMQTICLKHGINKVSIPDLLIVQHAIQYDYAICALDAHFRLMERHLPFSLFEI